MDVDLAELDRIQNVLMDLEQCVSRHRPHLESETIRLRGLEIDLASIEHHIKRSRQAIKVMRNDIIEQAPEPDEPPTPDDVLAMVREVLGAPSKHCTETTHDGYCRNWALFGQDHCNSHASFEEKAKAQVLRQQFEAIVGEPSADIEARKAKLSRPVRP